MKKLMERKGPIILYKKIEKPQKEEKENQKK